jgi:hypothetical protein
MGRKIAAMLAIIGWISLILQFVLHLTNPVVPEPGIAERFVRFFSYFTVSTNIIVATALTVIAFFPLTRMGEFFRRPTVQAAVASYISIVGIVYSLFLRSVWDPQGWNAVADHLLHDAMPLAFVIYWLIFAPKHGIKLNDPVKWLIYPLIYIVYSLVRGAFVLWYPYWFVDVTKLGYTAALTNTVLVLIAFVIIGFIYAGIAGVLSRANASD